MLSKNIEAMIYNAHLLPEEQEKIDAVEKALGFKLFVWQKTLITRGVSRKAGQTTALIIAELLKTDRPLDLTTHERLQDLTIWCTGQHTKMATQGFKIQLLKIKTQLEEGGVRCRDIEF